MNTPEKSTLDLPPYSFVSREIDRRLMAILTPSEFCVMRFILDRTLAHGKEWEVIPVRHFLTGSHEGGEDYVPTLHFSRRTLITCIKSLLEIQLVRVDRARPHRRYALGELFFYRVKI
jgi:hypothetical protein